jgi:hypothetical protein
MASSGMPSMMPGMRGPGRRRAAVGDEEEVVEEQETEHLLFRFFDFSVQPGKHYRYRVKLVMANPNFGMLPHFLERDGMEKVKTLEAEWSEPSPTVSVPVDSQVLAVSARPDGTATLMMVRFVEKDGAAAAEEFATIQRGQFLNYPDRPFPETSPRGMMGAVGSSGPMGMYSAGAAAPKDEDAPERKIDYLTNTLLLDVVGGGRLPGKDRSIAEPGSILLLDGEGKLVVKNELDDLPEYRLHKPPEKTAVAGGPATRGKRGKGAAASGESDAVGGYMGAMEMMPGMAPGKAGKAAKGSKKGGSSSGMMGMTPGMMPGSSSGGPGMGMDSLDDKPGKRKKKPRGS